MQNFFYPLEFSLYLASTMNISIALRDGHLKAYHLPQLACLACFIHLRSLVCLIIYFQSFLKIILLCPFSSKIDKGNLTGYKMI